MAKKKAETEPDEAQPLGRLKKLVISNYRCIGKRPVEVDLDDVVVLVGGNNVGKSTILQAYETVMDHRKLTYEDFPNQDVDPSNSPEIEIHTVVTTNKPASKWIKIESNGEEVVRERWVWKKPGEPKREGFNVETDSWDESVPWGAPNIAKSRRAKPYRVNAFADPDTQAQQICKILLDLLRKRMTLARKEGEVDVKSRLEVLYDAVAEFQTAVVEDTEAEVERIEELIAVELDKVFPGYVVDFDARPEDDISKIVTPFKTESKLRMGPRGGTLIPVSNQGSGARRTLLWTALRVQADLEEGRADAGEGASGRPGLLLIDEPEICLHPNAIRDACKVLYDLPKSGSWQVMATTHCPIFIDLSRDNTTIIRVEMTTSGDITGTTVFRPSESKLDDDDRRRLKLLNIFDPYVAEFFFGGQTIIVEGDTEYTVFKYVAEFSTKSELFKNIHVVRARGKDTIVSLAKILNHFGNPYSVLHDSDSPTILTKAGKVQKNGKWTTNDNIRKVIEQAQNPLVVRHLVTLGTFETAYLGTSYDSEKPYKALEAIQDVDSKEFKICEELLTALISTEKPPEGCVVWEGMEQLEAAYQIFSTARTAGASVLPVSEDEPSTPVIS